MTKNLNKFFVWNTDDILFMLILFNKKFLSTVFSQIEWALHNVIVKFCTLIHSNHTTFYCNYRYLYCSFGLPDWLQQAHCIANTLINRTSTKIPPIALLCSPGLAWSHCQNGYGHSDCDALLQLMNTTSAAACILRNCCVAVDVVVTVTVSGGHRQRYNM